MPPSRGKHPFFKDPAQIFAWLPQLMEINTQALEKVVFNAGGGATSGRQHILWQLMRGQLIECVCYGRPNKLDFFPLVTYWNGVFSNGCCPHLTRPTYTLISKTCSALRSQLLCSSWCHLNLVPAGLSGVDKTPLPDNTPPSSGPPQEKKRGACCYEDGLPSRWHWFPLRRSHGGVLTQLRQLIFNKRGSQLPLMNLHLSVQVHN